MQAVLLVACIFETSSINEGRTLHVYQTASATPVSLQHHCIYYYVLDDVIDYRETNINIHELIQYCIRPARADEWQPITNQEINHTDALTFMNLRLRNVSSERLYAWSASVDVVEQYQVYLENESSTNVLLSDCPFGWFGSRCQYTFQFDSIISLSDIVRFTSEAKIKMRQVDTMTCYLHLLCNRGPAPSCLDWREVCNGIIDCGIDGKDEDYCWLLEGNECGENEYRCHNGAQCIPKEFFQDDPLNPDCQDQTDELLPIASNKYADLYPNNCYRDPAFRCEETTCKPITAIGLRSRLACGDGECIVAGRQCSNKRNTLLDAAMWMLPLSKSKDICWLAMACLTTITDHIQGTSCTKFCANSNCTLAIVQSCPPMLEFPTKPVLLGHVHFIYVMNQTLTTRFPEYLCYDKQRCADLHLSLHSINGSTCAHVQDLPLIHGSGKYRGWSNFMHDVIEVFRFCLMIPMHYKNQHILYSCANSSKFISQHCLLDGVRDCAHNDDEQYKQSCALNSIYRFKCTTENKCIAPFRVLDGKKGCLGGEDELAPVSFQSAQNISFQTICDGFQELDYVLIDDRNESDETQCDYWPCNNTYTHCNKLWNCPKGIDEVNCYPSVCPSLEHMCISPLTYNITCLPIAQVEDGIVNCIGASDERQLCRDKEFRVKDNRFLYSNSSYCISPLYLCDGAKDCQANDDQNFCTNYGEKGDWICYDRWASNRTEVESLLGALIDGAKRKTVHFHLWPSIAVCLL